jgi:hypothetical protein
MDEPAPEDARDARVQARAQAGQQAAEIARLQGQLEAAQLEVVRQQRLAQVAAAQGGAGAQGGGERRVAAPQQPPPAFTFPTKVAYPELTKLTRKAFENFRLEYGKSFRQATVQNLVPKAFQDCIEPTVAKQVMQLCGLTPLQIHEAGAEWLALTRQDILTAVATKFFTEASASELERYYASVAVGSYSTCDEQLQAIQAFQQELAALDANIVAAQAVPPAVTTKVEIILTTLRKTPQAAFLLTSKKFLSVDGIFEALLPQMTFAARAQRQLNGYPGFAMVIAPVKIHAVDADEPATPPPPDPLAALRAELNALKAQIKVGGGGGGGAAKGAKPPAAIAADPASTTPLKCGHCASEKHLTAACWYLHIPLVDGRLIIPPEERARVRVAHGLPAVFVRSATPRKSRAQSPVNPSNCLGGLRAGEGGAHAAEGAPDTVAVPLLALQRLGQRTAATRRQARQTSAAAPPPHAQVAAQAPTTATNAPLHRTRRRTVAQCRALTAAQQVAQQASAAAAQLDATIAALAPATGIADVADTDPDMALLILEGRASAAALIDSGTSHNIISCDLAAVLEAGGSALTPVHRVIRGGGQVIGASTHEVFLQVRREKGGINTTTSEHFIVFDTGHDVILGAPLLKRWGWVDFSAIRRPAAVMAVVAAPSAAGSRALPGFMAAKRKLLRQRQAAAARTPPPSSTTKAKPHLTVDARRSTACTVANAKWAAFKMLTPAGVPLAAVTAGDIHAQWAARQRSLRSNAPMDSATEESGQAWAQRQAAKAAPQRSCLKGSSPPAPAATAVVEAALRRTRFWVAGLTLSAEAEHKRLLQRAAKMDGSVTAEHGRLMRTTGVRPAVCRGEGRHLVATFAIGSERPELLLKADEADALGEAEESVFYRKLHATCVQWGYYARKRIFSPDLSTPSKMQEMDILLKPGAVPPSARLTMRRHTPVQKDEVRKQLIAMLHHAVAERATPEAWMSAVHLARKPAAAQPASPEWTAAAAARAAQVNNIAGGGATGPSFAHLRASGVAVEDPEVFADAVTMDVTQQPSPSGSCSAESEHFVTLHPREIQALADACGLHGAAAMELVRTHAISADVHTGDAVIRWRFCIDFRRINSVTVDEFFPFPETRECMEYLAGCTLFGAVDLSAMYWQIVLKESARYLTGFATEDGTFQFRRVPFGLKNSGAHSQKAFRAVLRSNRKLDMVNNYLDDCFWGTKGPTRFQDYLDIVEALFQTCELYNIKLNPDKTKLGEKSLRVLGHVVSERGMEIDPARAEALYNIEEPSGKTGLKQVSAALGAMGYVRGFIPNFSIVAAPLTGMKVFEWGEDQREAWRKLKELIKHSGVLSNPDYTKEFYLKSDSSVRGLGGCLFQWATDAVGKPQRNVVAYCSKKYCQRERNWKTIEQECFSAIYSLQRFRPLIAGCKVTILNDHRNLVWLQSNDTSSKVVRWSMVLDEYSVTWRHIPGKAASQGVEDARVADDLSRGFSLTPAPETTPALATEREQTLHDDLDVQLNALGALTQKAGVSWDARMPAGMQVAVMALAVQACSELAEARAADDAHLFPVAAAAGSREERAEQRATTQAQAAAAQQVAWQLRVTANAARIARDALAAQAEQRQEAGAPGVMLGRAGRRRGTKARGRAAVLAAAVRQQHVILAASAAVVAEPIATQQAVAPAAALPLAATPAAAALAQRGQAAAAAAAPESPQLPAQRRDGTKAPRRATELGAAEQQQHAIPAASSAAVAEPEARQLAVAPAALPPVAAPAAAALAQQRQAAAAAPARLRQPAQRQRPRARPVAAAVEAAANAVDPPAVAAAAAEAGAPTTAAALAASSRALLAAARRLASAGKRMVEESPRFMQNRQSAAPAAYEGKLLQARKWKGHMEAGRRPEDPEVVILRWSELGEGAKREHFERAHNFPAHHPGIDATRDRIVRSGHFGYPNDNMLRGELERMREDVSQWCKTCSTCQLLAKWNTEDETLSPIPARPWADVSLDYCELPTDSEGYNAAWSLTDNFSGWIETVPVKTQTALDAARLVLRTMGRTNFPLTIRHDQAPNLASDIVDALTQLVGSVACKTVPHVHHTNPMAERVHWEIVRALRSYVLDSGVKLSPHLAWGDLLPFVQRALNRTPNSKTKKSPSELMFGSRVDLDREIFDGDDFPNRTPVRVGGYVQALMEAQEGILRAAMEHQARRLAKVMEGRQLTSQIAYLPGEWVIVRLPDDQPASKLQARWAGPFRVLERTSDTTYTVMDTSKGTWARDTAASVMCKFEWGWYAEGDLTEAEKTAYAEDLVRRTSGVARATPLAITAVRTKSAQGGMAAHTIRPLAAGRGLKQLSSHEFLTSFAEQGTQPAWLPYKTVDGTPAFARFLEANPLWRP